MEVSRHSVKIGSLAMEYRPRWQRLPWVVRQYRTARRHGLTRSESSRCAWFTLMFRPTVRDVDDEAWK